MSHSISQQMESVEPTPSKVRRVVHNTTNMHVSECIRQFKLPQQFPSTVVGHKPIAREHTLSPAKTSTQAFEKQPQTVNVSAKNKLTNKGNNVQALESREEKIIHQTSSQSVLNGTKLVNKAICISDLTTRLKTYKKLPSNSFSTNEIKTIQKISPVSTTSFGVNVNSPNQFKTLKLKSPDGKDLGEFQVTVLGGSSNSLKRKLITFTKDAPSKDERQGNEVVSSTQVEPVVSYSMKDVQYPGAIYQEPRIERVGKDGGNKVKIISNVSLNRLPANAMKKIIQGKQMIKKMFQNTSFDSETTTKVNNPWIKMDTNKIIVSNKDNKKECQINSQKLLYLKPEEHPYLKNITQSGKPIALKPLKLKSLNIKTNEQTKEESLEIMNFTGTGGLSGYKNGDMDEELKSNEMPMMDSKTGKKSEVNSSNQKKNVMVMLPKVLDKKTSRRNSSESSSDFGSLGISEDDLDSIGAEDSNYQDHGKQNKKTKLDESKSTNNESNTINQIILVKKKPENPVQQNTERDLPTNDGMADMKIVERALACVKDKSLREEALKILATCKLGADRQIPVRSSTDEISVCDTTCQTNVFGNLDPECEEFIEVKEDEKGLKRINKKMRDRSMAFKSLNSILTPMDEDQNRNHYTTQMDKLIKNLDLNSKDKEEVTSIKKVLDMPIQSTERIIQIQKQIAEDIKMLTDYDEDGLTGLHRAVMQDNNRTVKRLLMMLRVTNKDVDMKTHDERTSLEIALKNDADPDIVNYLLQAGAKPTSDEVGYDSALIIASKNSSPLLPQLIKYASKKSLDTIDTEGFAAIHNCAMRGNVTAIKALVAAGADINLQDLRSGRTALFHAIENQQLETARQLLSLGAKSNLRNHDGQTILPLLDDTKSQSLKNAVSKSMK